MYCVSRCDWALIWPLSRYLSTVENLPPRHTRSISLLICHGVTHSPGATLQHFISGTIDRPDHRYPPGRQRCDGCDDLGQCRAWDTLAGAVDGDQGHQAHAHEEREHHVQDALSQHYALLC